MGGAPRSEHGTESELVVGEVADLFLAVEDGDLAVAAVDADGLAGDAAAAQDAVPVDADVAGRGDGAGLGAGRVEGPGVGQVPGPRAVAGPPAGDGRDVADGLVRADGVVRDPPPLAVGGVVVAGVAAGVERVELAVAGAVQPLDLALRLGVV